MKVWVSRGGELDFVNCSVNKAWVTRVIFINLRFLMWTDLSICWNIAWIREWVVRPLDHTTNFCKKICLFFNFHGQLRNHLALIQKHQNQPLSINLNSPESQQVHLDTRLFQLETAIHMELWQVCEKTAALREYLCLINCHINNSHSRVSL